MSSFQKCYYCGGENDTSRMIDDTIQCQYCRRWISVPSRLDQEKQALYDLGKQKMELLQFEEAEKDFQALIRKDPENGDAYWQALLCHYGVEYILDEASRQNIPTITLLSKEPILEHSYYVQAIQNAENDELRTTWRAEAEHISKIIQMYEKIAAAEKGYDVFISVKQGTAQGTPTSDSFEAAQLMKFLEEKGLRVFNSRFSLKDIIGQEYEPYIMAALLSARAMVVVGSSRDYLEARWVRNEWRRFRWLQENSQEKRVLIPFLLGMSPNDVPTEMGAIQCVVNTSASPYADILRAIRKAVPLKMPKIKRPAVVPANLSDAEKEEWLERVRKDLDELNELRDCVMPDLTTARDASVCADVIVGNLKSLEGFTETGSMTREADALRRHFRSEYERIRLTECVSLVDEITDMMRNKTYTYADACDIQDELSKIQTEIYGYSDQSLAQSVQQKVKELLNEIRKNIVRLNPDNIITDPLRHALAVGKNFIAGLRKDGTVLVTGKGRETVADAETWTDIISLAAGSTHLVGLRRDGTVVATGNNRKKQCDVAQWKNIIGIVASKDHTIALGSEGNCRGTGDNSYAQLNVTNWKNIVSVSTTERFTLACDRDGKVYAAGDSKMQATHVSGWTDVDRLYAIDKKAMGIRSDGDVLILGNAPKSESRQASMLNKKRKLYRAFACAGDNSFAALTGTGDVSMFVGLSVRLWSLLVFVLSVVLCIVSGNLAEECSRYDDTRLQFIVFLVLAIFSGGAMLWIGVSFLVKLLHKARVFLSLFRWKKVVEIVSNDQGEVLIGLKKDGSVLTVSKAYSPQWFGIGLPDLEE